MNNYILSILISCLCIISLPIKAAVDTCVALIVSGSEVRPFWANVIEGALQAGNELGLKIHARGTVNDLDTAGQHFIIEDIQNKYHCRGLVIAPSDVSRNADVVRLKAAGIPTVYVDRDTGGERVAVIKTDNHAAGRLAADKMAEVLGGKGKVLLFRLEKGVTSTDAREEGFAQQAEKRGLQVISGGYLGSRIGDARSRATETFRHSGHIDGIFTPNDTTTIGVLMAHKNHEKFQKVVHIGFDEQEIILESLQEGILEGYIIQLPFEMGYQGVYAVYRAIHGESLIADVDTPVMYVDSSSLKSIK